ncbi:unnamed protein product [Ceutorhynchus assimilis]|uniref:Uncharacterized protein n=1 Tax=Ceutorhynchus assimilis TaxID=467358 RepID=A0A9N9MFM3_9CUCU|nr:unnamed protein product [Ceutorhynchus assimilis]
MDIKEEIEDADSLEAFNGLQPQYSHINFKLEEDSEDFNSIPTQNGLSDHIKQEVDIGPISILDHATGISVTADQYLDIDMGFGENSTDPNNQKIECNLIFSHLKVNIEMVDCVQIMRENSQAFLYNLKTTDFTLRSATKGFLQENGGSILCLETTDVDVTRVLLAQVLMNFKKDTILKNNLNEILFIDFSSLTTLTPEQNEDFVKNFPNLLVCIWDNQEQFSKQLHILESLKNVIKVNGKKIIFIVKNSKHLENTIMDNEMTNIFTLKLNELWKKNEILSTNNEAICEVEINLVNIESTPTRALDEITNINSKEKESTIKTSSHDEATTEEADLKNLLQSLGVEELDAVDKFGDTQLHLAVRHGKTEIVESLLVHRAKRDVKNIYGDTALHLAAEKGNSTIVHLLLESGFNVNVTDNLSKYTPLHNASLYHDDAHLVEILLKFGAEMERRNNIGKTALHMASFKGHSAVVNSLLKNGANINARDNNGNTPSHLATFGNKPEVVLILLQNGALLNIKNKQQQNTVDLARSSNLPDITQILENHK